MQSVGERAFQEGGSGARAAVGRPVWLQCERRVAGGPEPARGPGVVGRTLAFILRATGSHWIVAPEKGLTQFSFSHAHFGCGEGPGGEESEGKEGDLPGGCSRSPEQRGWRGWEQVVMEGSGLFKISLGDKMWWRGN